MIREASSLQSASQPNSLGEVDDVSGSSSLQIEYERNEDESTVCTRHDGDSQTKSEQVEQRNVSRLYI